MDEDRQQNAKGYSGWRTFGVVTLITFKWLIIFGLLIGLLVGGAVTGYVAALVKDDPIRSRAEIEAQINENAITGFAYFNDGQTPIGQLRTEEDRRLIEEKDIPQVIIDAVLATEDNNFYEHIGVDVNGLGRAVKQKVLNEDVQTGGSTLTQQLARRVFLNLDKTDSRKVKEIFLSLRLERFLTKSQILTAYLNKVPFGTGANGYNLYGIKAASKGIFNIADLNKLNIAQAAYLAGLPQRPSAYTAFTSKGTFNEKNFKLAMDRQRIVLSRMLETKRITQAQYDEAVAFDIKGSLAPLTKKAYSTFPYLMLETERQAAEILLMQKDPNLTLTDVRKKENASLVEEARQELLRNGYRIYTTIDKKVYNLMHAIGSNPDNFSPDSKEKGVEQIAAIMIDHKTGAILGMLEGRDFYEEQMNHATQMTRQPGSTMKPIAAYLPAIEKGLVQPGSILDDAPVVFKDGEKGFHIPKNSDNKYHGLVTAREALNRSLNLPALKVFNEKVTISEAWNFARKLGITSLQPEDEYAQTGVIGGLSVGVSVEELTNAYGAIANNGVFNDAYMISRITDSEGHTIYEHKAKPQRVFSEQSAFLMTDMLRTVVADGSGTGHRLTSEFKNYKSIPIVGKTGSTQSYGDVWFEGYTPDITLGVWAGYEKQVNTLSKAGRARARQIWAQIMNDVTEARPDLFPTEEFKQPDDIVKATVSSVSGKKPTELTRSMGMLVTDWFNKIYLPKESDDALIKMAYIPFNGVNYVPQATTPSDMVREQVVVKREKPLDVLMEEIEKAQAKLPSDSRRPMSFYLPMDAKLDAPSKTDPRAEDGAAPSPPSNIRLELVQGNSAFRITFAASPEKDVVGYRLYRAASGKSFSRTGSPVLTGEETRFVDYITAGVHYEYYVTAVDVGGHESAPSIIATSNGQQINGQPANRDGGDTEQAASTGDGSILPDAGNVASPGDVQTRPTPPTGLSAITTSLGVRIEWQPNADAEQVTAYNVYYSAGSDGNYQKLDTIADTKFDYIVSNVSGTYFITAVNATGESDGSAALSVSSP